MNSRKYGLRGFSFVELMTAIGILSTGILLVLGMFPSSLSLIRKSRNSIVATCLAQKEMENIKALPYAALKMTILQSPLPLGPYPSPDSGIVFSGYASGVEETRDRLAVVKVVIQWREKNALSGEATRQVVLETRIYRYSY
ncbi:MAG: hypothetical protein HYU64_07475 [Armatimonadetes bacterium]|nr:hypothetical protein [Armatimonadota bacterium]